MRKVLVPVSPIRAQMQSAVDEAIAIYRQEAVEIHLVNVQSAIPRYVAAYFDRSELRRIQQDASLEELAPAQALLDAAGIACITHIEIGRNAETIVQLAGRLGCDRIVMGRPEHVGITEKLFGTLASQVRHLVGVGGNCTVIGS